MSNTPHLPLRQLLIDGQWYDGQATMPVHDKYTLQPYAHLGLPSREQVGQAVAAAERALRADRLTPHERGAILDRAADILERRREDIVQTVIREVGFPHQDAASELARCLQTFRLSAEEARRLCGEVIPLEGAAGQAGRMGFTMRVPVGVVCAITPFNAPLNTVAHKLAPALAAGNAVVLKPSSYTPTPSIVMAEALLEAGLPPGMLAVVHGDAETAGWLLDDERVNFYAFTGSTQVGRAIQQRAGLRRTQMELGSIAFTILAEDTDLADALPRVVAAAYRKAGQVCTSVQRVLVHRKLYEPFCKAFAAQASKVPFGDPALPDTVVGPMISLEHAERIDSWVAEAVAGGATLLCGGKRHGTVYEPTVLTDVPPTVKLACHENFAPVVNIVPFDDLQEAFDQANATPFGLAVGIFTSNISTAMLAAQSLDFGGIHVNETSSSRVDVMPFGGVKESGYGREGPRYAVREMMEERLMTIAF